MAVNSVLKYFHEHLPQGPCPMKRAINRLPALSLSNGVKAGWLPSPGVIAGVTLNVNLKSLDRLLPKNSTSQTPNSVAIDNYQSAPLGFIPFILERFAFKKTARLDTSAMHARLEKIIGSATAKSHRHSLAVSCSVPENQISDSLRLISELIEGPADFTDEDVNELYQMLRYEAWDLSQPLQFEEMLRDLIHAAAYNPSRTILARTSPILPFAGDLNSERKKDEICAALKEATLILKKYWKETVLADPAAHFCIVGGGCEGESEQKFASLAEELFGSIKPTENVKEEAKSELSPYCGGMLNWPSEEAPLCNLSVALKAPQLDSKSHIPLAVLQMLLGGGGSFSAGGPGKGMYSRLYTQLLNRYHWLEHARAFTIDYQIGGLFGINASCHPKFAPNLLKILFEYLSVKAADALTTEELSRAKNQLKSAILMGLETRSLSLESFAEQLSAGKYLDAHELCAQIDATSENDLHRVLKQINHNAEISVVAQGQTSYVPSFTNISQLFRQITQKLK